ncbi:hypothetical protein SFRURICE_010235 [Spodoptera frugiperda]|nr:hypothetical protein SFRURICE_010235 [Spodoptera frugiperda]
MNPLIWLQVSRSSIVRTTNVTARI